MKRQGTANNFTGGLVMDLNPATTPKNVLVGALNATLNTNNGNEGVLLNDMGNTQVETAFLPEGYAPIGTCEYGGIIYVVSYNPITNHTLVGSFPSPETTQSSNELGLKRDTTVNDESFLEKWEEAPKIDVPDIKDLWEIKIANKSKLVLISEDNLTAGDKFIPYRHGSELGPWVQDLGTNKSEADRVKLTIVSIEESGRIVELSNIKERYEQSSYEGDNWYIFDNKDLSATFISHRDDLLETYRKLASGLQSNYLIFSSKIPGKLGLRFDLLSIEGFDVSYTPIESQTPGSFDLIFNFSWEGEGIPQHIVCVDTTSKIDQVEKNTGWYDRPLGSTFDDESSSETVESDNAVHPAKCWNISIGDNGESDYTVYYYEGVPQFKDDNTITYNNGEDLIDDSKAIQLGRVIYKRFETKQPRFIGGNPNIRTYRFYPVMAYGVDVDLMLEIVIDFSKIHSGEYSLTKWKYLLDGESINIDFTLELYPTFNYEVTSIELKFWDDLEKSIASYYISDRTGYSGDYQIVLPLNAKSAIMAMTPPFNLWDAKDDDHYHLYQHQGLLVPEPMSAHLSIDSEELYYKDKEDISNGSTIYFNDWGTLYGNSCYLVDIIIKTKLSSDATQLDISPFSGGLDTVFNRILWTNGIFNPYYYEDSDDYSDFTKLKVELLGSVNMLLNSDKNTDNTGCKTEGTLDGTIKTLTRKVTYNMEAKTTSALYNGLGTFLLKEGYEIPHDLYISENQTIEDGRTTENQVNRVYRSDVTILNEKGNEVKSNLFDDLLKYSDYNNVFIISDLDGIKGITTGDTILFLTNNGEYLETEYSESALASTSKKLKDLGKYSYKWKVLLTAENFYLVTLGPSKNMIIMRPLVQTLLDAQKYGFDETLRWEHLIEWQRGDYRAASPGKILIWHNKAVIEQPREQKNINGTISLIYYDPVPGTDLTKYYKYTDTFESITENGETHINYEKLLDHKWEEFYYTTVSSTVSDLHKRYTYLSKTPDYLDNLKIINLVYAKTFSQSEKDENDNTQDTRGANNTSYSELSSDKQKQYYLLFSEYNHDELIDTGHGKVSYAEMVSSIVGLTPCLLLNVVGAGTSRWSLGIDPTNMYNVELPVYLNEWLILDANKIDESNYAVVARRLDSLGKDWFQYSVGFIKHPFYQLGWPASNGSIHPTNTFFRLGYSYRHSNRTILNQSSIKNYSGIIDESLVIKKARNLILSLLSSVYIKKGATTTTLPLFIYPGDHTITFEHYLIALLDEISDINSHLLYTGGLFNSLDYTSYIKKLLTHCTKNADIINRHLTINLKQSQTTFPIQYAEEAPLPEVLDEFNILVEGLESEGVSYASGEVVTSKLYTIEDSTAYPIDGAVSFLVANFFPKFIDGEYKLGRSFYPDPIICDSPYFADEFEYKNGFLYAKHSKYNSNDDYFRVVNSRAEGEKKYPGGWADCRQDEVLFEGYDYVSQHNNREAFMLGLSDNYTDKDNKVTGTTPFLDDTIRGGRR